MKQNVRSVLPSAPRATCQARRAYQSSICRDVWRSIYQQLDYPKKKLSELADIKKGRFFKLCIKEGCARKVGKRLNGGIPAYGGNGISWYTDEK